MSVATDASVIQPGTSRSGLPVRTRTNSFRQQIPDSEIHRDIKVTIVNDEPTKLFIERQELEICDKLEYLRHGSNPGLVLIFNQESFEDDWKPYRQGSRRDVNELLLCFGRLGFNLNEDNVFTDLTKEEIFDVVDKVLSKDLTEVNSLIVFFLTHGENFNRLSATDLSLRTDELWEKFMKSESLKNKPKMFIFQACKGNKSSTTLAQTTDSSDLVADSTFSSNFMGPDMLVLYAATEGNVSFRDPITGTWFIQELCKNLTAYGRRDDVISIVIRTAKCLARNYYNYDKTGKSVQKQMPLFISTLTKKFYLNRNKDRSVLMKLVKEQEDIKKAIEDLKNTIQTVMDSVEKKT